MYFKWLIYGFIFKVASRLVPSQIIPTMTLDFELKNTDSTDKIEHVTLQTDAPNLLHLCQVIENAIKEGKSQHVRKIKKNLKI